MNKKKMLALALAVIMVASLSFGTLAWFNDSDSVTNKFMVATTEGGDPSDPDDIFSVDLVEKVDPDGDGQPEVVHPGKPEGEEKDATEFLNILPGSKYMKEPIVRNTGAYDQYIRVVVTLTDGAAWMELLGAGYDLSSIFLGHDEAVWTRDVGTRVGDNIIYVYYLNGKLGAGEEVSLFTHVQIPSFLTQEDMAKLDGGFDLTIRADAIQTENLGADAKTSFAMENWGNYVNTEPQP